MRREQRQQGFTLVEIMIALAIFGVVIAQAFAVFGAQHRTYTGTERAIEVQQDVRLIADAVLSDIRMAGYMVPRRTGIASQDGGVNNPDTICASDPSKLMDAEVEGATARFDRAKLTDPVGAGATSVKLASFNVDGDVANANDFAVDAGVIISDGTNSHCAVIDSFAGPTINFTPATPAGFSASVATGRVASAVLYSVAGTDLMRNDLRLSNQVEDLQIEFGVDGDGDGQIAAAEFLDILNGANPLDILAIRLSVIARADREDESIESSGRPAAANRNAGGTDGFRRRRVTATVIPRNLL